MSPSISSANLASPELTTPALMITQTRATYDINRGFQLLHRTTDELTMITMFKMPWIVVRKRTPVAHRVGRPWLTSLGGFGNEEP